jgi:hypothetical protein
MRLEKAETTNSKPDVNLLEEYIFGTPKPPKRLERMARSEKARGRRAEIKELRQGRVIKKG